MCLGVPVVADYDRQMSKLNKSVREVLPDLATESGVCTVYLYHIITNDMFSNEFQFYSPHS